MADTHPDLDGLTFDDFSDDCVWDKVALSLIKNCTYYKLWQSSFPIERSISNQFNLNPIILTMYTNIKTHGSIQIRDNSTYVIKNTSTDDYIQIFDFNWLPLAVKLRNTTNVIYLRLMKVTRGTKANGVSTGTGMILSSARTLFTYEPVSSILINKDHCWFSLLPHIENTFNLEIIRKLPATTTFLYTSV